MIYEEDMYVELQDGRKGLILFVRADVRTQYDVELADGELTTVYYEEIARPVERKTT